MDNQIKLRADLNPLPRLHHLAEGSETRPFPKGANLNTISTLLFSIRVDTHALPRPFFHLAKGNRTRPLLFILEEQILTLYSFTFHPGGAGHTLHGYIS